MLKHLDLFSGIGGFSLGLETAGLVETVAFCDFDEYCQQVLKKNFPGVPVYNDVKELNHERLKADGIDTIDIITGGYPCQPFSVAGRKKGEQDSRHVWPEMFRLIQELRPTWVIGENVGGHIKLGLDTVLENLESEGYSARTFSISASSIGANHKRERVWIMAHSDEMQRQFLCRQESEQTQKTFEGIGERSGAPISMADSERLGREEGAQESKEFEGKESSDQSDNRSERRTESRAGEDVADTEGSDRNEYEIDGEHGETETQEILRDGSSVSRVGSWWSVEPDVGRVAHGVPDRVDRLKCLGNSVVPQIPYVIGLTIKKILENE
jgi:DNA (cytosine-5)-methyltransferase 1